MLRKVGLAAAVASIVFMAGCGDKGDKGDTGATGAAGATGATGQTGATGPAGSVLPPDAAASLTTATPIKHVIVIFGENISFDHYFATYPVAQNPTAAALTPPETMFTGTAPANGVNNLSTPLDPNNAFAAIPNSTLLTNNPNSSGGSGSTLNAGNASNPFRLDPSQAATKDQGHNYTPEQLASDNGAMDLFPKYTGMAGPPPSTVLAGQTVSQGLVMGYYDGNTVTAMWNYAQNYALNDNSYTSQYGPSTPGAINLISGQTNGIIDQSKPLVQFASSHVTPDGTTDANGNPGYTLIGDADPKGDVCSTSTEQVTMAGKNVGDLLNAAKISWGAFMGGFDLTYTNPNGTTGCNRLTNPTVPDYYENSTDYIPHHAWFQYYTSTANPKHARPSSLAAIGSSTEVDGTTPEPANHNYDTHDFFDALNAGYLPAVSFLKAPAYQDGHAGYSNPIDEQTFVVNVINAVQASSFWDSTAVIINYDDSDGWYDHQFAPVANPSQAPAFSAATPPAGSPDQLNGDGLCTMGSQQGITVPAAPLLGATGVPVQGRCGYGTRVPLLVISPFAKVNYIDHTLTDQTSVLRFIEDNWLGGARIQAGGSFDTIAGSINNMFSFPASSTPTAVKSSSRKLVLDKSTGRVVSR